MSRAKPVKTKRMVVRVSPAEWEEINRLAKGKGLTVAELVRRCVFEEKQDAGRKKAG